MIQIEKITADEVRKLGEERITSYWALPIGISLILLALKWLFGQDWNSFFYLSGGLWMLFILSWLLFSRKQKPTVKLIRRGKITQAVYLGNNPIAKMNISQYVAITLESEQVPHPYPQLHTFTVWEATGMIYFQQDNKLRYRYQELKGKDVELEYLPEDGAVIAFRLLSTG